VNLYIAAMHRDKTKASAAFLKWLNRFSPENIEYSQHKLIGLLNIRFANEIAEHIHAGVIQNIARQGRLRAHANLGILRQTLSSLDLASYGLVALGEVRECLMSAPSQLGDCDSLELAVEQSDRDATVECLESAGWEIQNAPSEPHGRHVIVVNLMNKSSKASLRIFGVLNLVKDKIQFTNYKGLGVMSDHRHITFMQSPAACLLGRRDQFLFDIYRSRQTSGSSEYVSRLQISDLPWLSRLIGKRILG
jgi:hypothetical protein